MDTGPKAWVPGEMGPDDTACWEGGADGRWVVGTNAYTGDQIHIRYAAKDETCVEREVVGILACSDGSMLYTLADVGCVSD